LKKHDQIKRRLGQAMKIDIKTLITLLTIAATLGGFFYTTQSRLDSLEDEVTQLQKQVKRLARRQIKQK
tara:strand:- start:224 stop:430 length:207 start_codon:yes stop_codon:yes gene_type:complete